MRDRALKEALPAIRCKFVLIHGPINLGATADGRKPSDGMIVEARRALAALSDHSIDLVMTKNFWDELFSHNLDEKYNESVVEVSALQRILSAKENNMHEAELRTTQIKNEINALFANSKDGAMANDPIALQDNARQTEALRLDFRATDIERGIWRKEIDLAEQIVDRSKVLLESYSFVRNQKQKGLLELEELIAPSGDTIFRLKD